MHANSAFDSNEQFRLPRVDSTLSNESNFVLEDEEFNEEEEQEEEIIEGNEFENCIDENENCILDKCEEEIAEKLRTNAKTIEDINMSEEDEGVLPDDQSKLDDENHIEKGKIKRHKSKNLIEIKDSNLNKFKQEINQEHVTKVLVEGSMNRIITDRNLNEIEKTEESNNKSHKNSLSLESDDLDCSIEVDELPLSNKETILDNQPIQNKRRVSILKDYAQSTLMASTSSGISSSSCNSTLNTNKAKGSSRNRILIRCVRIYHCVPYGSFNFKIKCINLIPEYLQDNIVITPESIYSNNNEQHSKLVSSSSINNTPKKADYQFEFNDQMNSSLNTLNTLSSLPNEPDQQRVNMINILNAASQNRILEQKRIKQFVNFVKDYLQGTVFLKISLINLARL